MLHFVLESADEIIAGKVYYPAKECEIVMSSVAGVTPSRLVNLLFWEDRLIRMVVKFDYIRLDDAADLRSALIETFGKPKRELKPPFRTDTWTQQNTSLELEMTWINATPTAASLYLTNKVGFEIFQKANQEVRDEIAGEQRRKRLIDIR